MHKRKVYLAFNGGEFCGVAPQPIEDHNFPELYRMEGVRWIPREVTRTQLEYICEGDISEEEFNRTHGFFVGQ